MHLNASVSGYMCCYSATWLQEKTCKTEKHALEETISDVDRNYNTAQRRLRQYTVVDASGDIIPLQRIGLTGDTACFLTGSNF